MNTPPRTRTLLLLLAAVGLASLPACHEAAPVSAAAHTLPPVAVEAPPHLHEEEHPALDALHALPSPLGERPAGLPGHRVEDFDALYSLAAAGKTAELGRELHRQGIGAGQALLHFVCSANNAETLRWALRQGCKPESGQNYWSSILSGDSFKGCDNLPGLHDGAALPLVRVLVDAEPALLHEPSCSLFLRACHELDMPQTHVYLLQKGVAELK